MSLSTDSVAKEGRPKFNPWPGQGLNLGASSRQSEIFSYQLYQPRTHKVAHLNAHKRRESMAPSGNNNRNLKNKQFIALLSHWL